MRRSIPLMLSFALAVVVAGCRSTGTEKSAKTASPPAHRTAAAGDSMKPLVDVVTSMGNFVIEMDVEDSPAASMHFAQYIDKGFYNGTIFHRVPNIPVIIQGGGYTPDMKPKNARYSTAFAGLWSTKLKNADGTVAMLRGQGPAGTGTAEFYINMGDNWMLDEHNDGSRFAVLGRVVEGMVTLKRIRNVPVGTNPAYADGQSRVVPIEPIVIKSMRLRAPFDYDMARARAEEMQVKPTDDVAAVIDKMEKEAGAKVTRTDSGVIYVDMEVGRGATPIISDRVEFDYTGTFLNGKRFESTDGRDPFVRPVSKLNAGMMEMVLSMKEGGRRVAIVPPDLAYGTAGIPGIIPPGATLIYDVRLLSILGPAEDSENPDKP